jgi:ferredoxin-NADP reductase
VDPGARVDVDGPVGQFTLPSNPDEWRLVFIAGGTGIAPLRAMLRDALRAPYQEILLLYSVRTPDEFAYEAELVKLANEGRIGLVQTVTRSDGAGAWVGARGRIGRTQLEPLVRDPSTLCFICGPPPFVNDTKQVLQDFGVPLERILT